MPSVLQKAYCLFCNYWLRHNISIETWFVCKFAMQQKMLPDLRQTVANVETDAMFTKQPRLWFPAVFQASTERRSQASRRRDDTWLAVASQVVNDVISHSWAGGKWPDAIIKLYVLCFTVSHTAKFLSHYYLPLCSSFLLLNMRLALSGPNLSFPKIPLVQSSYGASHCNLLLYHYLLPLILTQLIFTFSFFYPSNIYVIRSFLVQELA